MSLDSLPTEIILNIASFLHPSLASLNSLSQTNKRSHSILERTLYTEDVQHHASSSVYWATEHGNLTVLRKAINLGKAHIPTRGNYASVRDDGSRRLARHIQERNRGFLFGRISPQSHWEIDRDHPICLATRNGHEHLVRFLLNEVGCSPLIRDRYDFCLLSLAIMCGSGEEMIRTFLDLGVHQYVRGMNGYCPLQIAAFIGDTILVDSLLASTTPNYVEQRIQDSFEIALLARQIPVALQLLDYGGVNLNCHLSRCSEDGKTYVQTPLGWAVFYEDLDLVEKFLDKGADADFGATRGHRQVLFDAVERIQRDMVEFLVKRTTDRVARTKALSIAVKSASWSEDPTTAESEVVEILLKNGVDCNFEEDDIQPPPAEPQPHGLGSITACSFPGPKKQNGQFIPPIVYAVHAGNLRLVRLLLSHGADVNTSYRQLLKTESKFCCGRVLDLAMDRGHQEIADFLLESGAKPDLGRPPYKEENEFGGERAHSNSATAFLNWPIINRLRAKPFRSRSLNDNLQSTPSNYYSNIANSNLIPRSIAPQKKKNEMPTPESAAFLAKKPTVPPTYEGVDFDDNVAIHNARDAIIREQWVRSMMARLVGEELGKCYAREGVNHFEKCGKLRERYLELLKDRKIKGYLFEEKNYFSKSS